MEKYNYGKKMRPFINRQIGRMEQNLPKFLIFGLGVVVIISAIWFLSGLMGDLSANSHKNIPDTENVEAFPKVYGTQVISPTPTATPTINPITKTSPTPSKTPKYTLAIPSPCAMETCESIDECSKCPKNSKPRPEASGVLQFKSGFEHNTYIEREWMIKGTDITAPSGINNWDKLSDYLPWMVQANAYTEGGTMMISADPINPSNQVLHLFNSEKAEDGDRSRSQWTLHQETSWSDPGGPNKFDQQFYRYRIFIPKNIETLYSFEEYSEWYMIWESHVWESENTRHIVNIKKGKDSNFWYFRVRQQRPEQNTIWENLSNQYISVPFGEWFTFEVFFKYHETDGEFYVAITREGGLRQVVTHFRGKTKYDTKLHDQMVFKLYHHSDYLNRLLNAGYDGTHQYYDDFEIWSDYPPGYWSTENTK